MINQNSKPNVKSFGERIKDFVEAGKAKRYIVSVNKVGEAGILGI
jgi:hypothetical protein